MKKEKKEDKKLNHKKLKFIKESSIKYDVQFGACSMNTTCYSSRMG